MGESTIGLPARSEPPPSGGRSLLRRISQVDEIGVIGALIVLIVLLALLVPDTFLTFAPPGGRLQVANPGWYTEASKSVPASHA